MLLFDELADPALPSPPDLVLLLLGPALAVPLLLLWLDVGVGAWEGVVCADEGAGESCADVRI